MSPLLMTPSNLLRQRSVDAGVSAALHPCPCRKRLFPPHFYLPPWAAAAHRPNFSAGTRGAVTDAAARAGGKVERRPPHERHGGRALPVRMTAFLHGCSAVALTRYLATGR